MIKQVIIDEEICEYFCDSNQWSLNLLSDSDKEFTNNVTIHDLLNDKYNKYWG